MLEGRTNAQIASEIGLKAKTISNYKAQIRRFAAELGYEFVVEERRQRFESYFIGERPKSGGK
jgi:DNA-binding CsgD family transcriptional regulator